MNWSNKTTLLHTDVWTVRFRVACRTGADLTFFHFCCLALVQYHALIVSSYQVKRRQYQDSFRSTSIRNDCRIIRMFAKDSNSVGDYKQISPKLRVSQALLIALGELCIDTPSMCWPFVQLRLFGLPATQYFPPWRRISSLSHAFCIMRLQARPTNRVTRWRQTFTHNLLKLPCFNAVKLNLYVGFNV